MAESQKQYVELKEGTHKGVPIEWPHFYEVQDKAKLTDGNKIQNISCHWEDRKGINLKETRWNFLGRLGYVLHGLDFCHNSLNWTVKSCAFSV